MSNLTIIGVIILILIVLIFVRDNSNKLHREKPVNIVSPVHNPNELGTCESYGTDPRYPPPPVSKHTFEDNIKRSKCLKYCWIDKNNHNRGVLCGGVRIFHPLQN
jgi:hypothetical protein